MKEMNTGNRSISKFAGKRVMGPGRLAIIALIFFASLRASADEGEWSRFRGPNGAGLSRASTVPAQWTEKDYNWKVKLPGIGHASPVLWDHRIYLTCGDPATAKRTVLCLNASDGRTLWQRDYPSKPYHLNRDNSYATATPAADAEGVVVTWTTSEAVLLLAFDRDGHEVWRRDLGPFVGIHGSGASPIIVGDLVVFANDQEDPKALPSVYGDASSTLPAGKSFLVALDRKTGQTRWQLQLRSSQAAYSTPCVYPSANGQPEVIFTSTSHGMTAVDAMTGKVKWEMEKVFRERCVSSPVVAQGLVIAGNGAGVTGLNYVAVRPGSPDTGLEPALVYEVKKPVPLVPTPLVVDNRLFLWGDNGQVTCLRATTGELVWRERVGAEFYGSPVSVNNRLYCVSKDGEVVVLAVSDKLEVLGRVPLGESSFATPAISRGVMYLRTFSQLFSVGGKKLND